MFRYYNNDKNHGCRCGQGFDDFSTNNTQDYNNFRYYDQYGSFNGYSSDNYNCKCENDYNKHDCYNKDNNHDKCDWDNKPCKPSYDKWPCKFICFPADKF